MRFFDLSARAWLLLAGAGSAALLAAALGFQFLGGLAPCPLCIWQRWPHVVAVLIALVGTTVLARQARPLAGLGALAMLIGAGLGLYHTGIERAWWQGPAACSAAGDVGTMSTDQLMSRIMDTPLVRCDEVVWELFGLSMASWNALASLALAGLWLMAAMRRQDSSSASQ